MTWGTSTELLTGIMVVSGTFRMPAIGLGTFRAGHGEVGAAVKLAIRAGYRLIDCAEIYGNESQVGDALKAMIAEGVVKREELFIVSKVFNNHHHQPGEDRVRQACEASVAALGVGPLDLYLMHWPHAFRDQELPKGGIRLPNGHPHPDLDITCEYLETWKQMEVLKSEGLVKDIGVANFLEEQLQVCCSFCFCRSDELLHRPVLLIPCLRTTASRS